MNKKLYMIIQVLVIILAFCFSSVFTIRTTSNLITEALEPCDTSESLETHGYYETTETHEPDDEPEPSNTQQTEEHLETVSTESTVENTEHAQATEVSTEPSTEPTTTESSSIEIENTETQVKFDWYYAFTTCEIEIQNDYNEVIDSLPSYSMFKVIWEDERNSRLCIEWENYLAYVSSSDSIIKLPHVLELECYFARTLCGLNLRDSEGELIELIPVNSLVYVIGTSSDDPERSTIINMCNGKVGTIAHGNVDLVVDAIFTSIDYQSVTLLREGKLIVKGDCVTGTKNRKDTPKGAFKVDWRQENFTGLLGGKKSDYWVHFYDGCGFHDASWRTTFGGTIYLYNGSSGCVNCPHDLAKTIYEYSYFGMPVYVA